MPGEVVALGHRIPVLTAFAEEPRAVILALHGGAASKEYFDSPVDPAHSLLRLGPALGFSVIAPDRPGYGTDDGAGRLGPRARTDLLYGVLEGALDSRPTGHGVFLLCHSMGCISGLRMAADHRAASSLLGIELSGTGLTRDPRADGVLGGGHVAPDRNRLGRLIWGPEELYPAGARSTMRRLALPPSEAEDTAGWPTELPGLAARVTVPVRYALAEHESWWRPGRPGLDEVRALFTAAPRVETAIEAAAGHNISIGRTARAYHLRALAFAELCIARLST